MQYLSLIIWIELFLWTRRTHRTTSAAKCTPPGRHAAPYMTHISESDLFSSMRVTSGRTMWEITSNYSFFYRLIAVYVKILVLLPSWNCRLRSLVNSVSAAITSYLICMSNESRVHPPSHLPVYYCNSYWVDWHTSTLLMPARTLSYYNAAMSNERFSVYSN